MLLKILTEPNPTLHFSADLLSPADLSTNKIQTLIANMIETMYTESGVGLAAPQIGESIRLCVISKDYNPLNKDKALVLINPTWEKTSIFKIWDEEGCLSIPLIFGQVKRYRKIKVNALNELGEPICFTAEDYAARVIQHEVDHLDGVLFVSKARKLHEIQKEL